MVLYSAFGTSDNITVINQPLLVVAHGTNSRAARWFPFLIFRHSLVYSNLLHCFITVISNLHDTCHNDKLISERYSYVSRAVKRLSSWKFIVLVSTKHCYV